MALESLRMILQDDSSHSTKGKEGHVRKTIVSVYSAALLAAVMLGTPLLASAGHITVTARLHCEGSWGVEGEWTGGIPGGNTIFLTCVDERTEVSLLVPDDGALPPTHPDTLELIQTGSGSELGVICNIFKTFDLTRTKPYQARFACGAEADGKGPSLRMDVRQ